MMIDPLASYFPLNTASLSQSPSLSRYRFIIGFMIFAGSLRSFRILRRGVLGYFAASAPTSKGRLKTRLHS